MKQALAWSAWCGTRRANNRGINLGTYQAPERIQMNLRAQLMASISGQAEETSGFRLPKPESQHFKQMNGFHKAVKEQAASIALVPANDDIRAIDADGKILGTDWHLSQAAFSDLCHWTNTPVGFIKFLAKVDETQALDVVQTMLRSVFRPGVGKSMVIDTRTQRVEGIVGTETYAPISNLDAIEYLMSASDQLALSNGWLSGPNMRLTVLSAKHAEARVGDVVQFGVNMENALHGDRSLKVAEYMERKSCTNGAICREKGSEVHIVHRGDIAYHTQKAVVHASFRAAEALPLIQAAATHQMMPNEIGLFSVFAKDPKNGGNENLWAKVVKQAKQEALDDGRTEEEVTLWNFVNSITQAAHDTSSLNRRGELEAMGYRALVRFGVQLINN